MTKRIILFICGIVMLASCSGHDGIKVSGNIKGAKNGTVYLLKETETGDIETVTSTPMSKDGTFTLYAPQEDVCLYSISFDASQPAVTFFMEGLPVTVEGQVDSLSSATVKGGENQRLYSEFKTFMRDFESKKSELYLNILTHSADAGDKDSLAFYVNAYNKASRHQMQYVANFAITNAEHEVSPLVALAYLSSGAYSPILDSIASGFTPQVKESLYGQEYTDFVSRIKAASVGQKAPAFEVVKDSTVYNNDTYQGKDLFVVMWADSSNECYEYLFALKKVYDKWHKKGLEVLSVCMSNDTLKYEHDSFYLRLPWTDVMMPKAKNNPVARQLALVGNFPVGVMIDKNGVIYARYITPEDLDAILSDPKRK